MALNYVKGWFVPDILSCASMVQYLGPLDGSDVLGPASGSGMDVGRRLAEEDTTLGTSRLAKLVRLTKLAKLLRLARMKRALSRLNDRAFEHVGGNLMIALGAMGSVLKLVGGFALAMHLISCIFYMIGENYLYIMILSLINDI